MAELLCYNGFGYHKNLRRGQKFYCKCSKYNVDKCPIRLIFSDKKVQQNLLLNLRERFNDSAYNIPSKKNIYSDIRDAYNSILFRVLSPRTAIKRTGKTNESYALMRYNSHKFTASTYRSPQFSSCSA
ncbi:hypothetical protein HZS_2158 [Henneguya salminicola]|nr:hypothetical protein HZS_2158 [Henneguya salminicola]